MTTIIINPSQLEALAALLRQTAGEYNAAAVRINAADTASCPPSMAAIAAEACTLLGTALSELANEFAGNASMLTTRANEAIAANTGGDAVSVSGAWAPAIATGGAVATLATTGDPFTDIMNAEAAAANNPANSMTITWAGVPDLSSQPADVATITWQGSPAPSTGSTDDGTITFPDPYTASAAQSGDGAWFGQPQSDPYSDILANTQALAGMQADPYSPLLAQQQVASFVPSGQVMAAPPDALYVTGTGDLVSGPAAVSTSVESASGRGPLP
jgi:hypothetical protein